jgi:2-C-methyl-D-erythritol 4-phosphate cytidylyltransferase/2-C-methyl-D-erythritol 2,4-cyclodiphosphate synthase
MISNAALIVAAGTGERVPGDVPKQYRPLGGKPVLRWAVEAFASHPSISETRVAIRAQDRVLYDTAVAGLSLPPPVIGGATRQETVRLGLQALAPSAPDLVLIHDAARPFVSRSIIANVLVALENAEGAAPFVPVADTLRRRSAGGFETVARDALLRTQTPQGFRYAAITAAHDRFVEMHVTDDIALLELAGGRVEAVNGEEINMKLTTSGDFALAEAIASAAYADTRTGSGFDVHKFTEGDHVWLCGVRVPHEFGLEGHSDADVGLHALTDAVLGALGQGDIGLHFPPTDARWRGAPSHIFLEHAHGLARAANAMIAHVDVTIICERPKIGPYREAMQARISAILQLDPARVSVKATTTEGLGFTGRREGIAAQALATLRFRP